MNIPKMKNLQIFSFVVLILIVSASGLGKTITSDNLRVPLDEHYFVREMIREHL